MLEPLKGQIDPAKSEFTVGKVKVEIRLAKMLSGRWGGLIGDSPDRKWRLISPLNLKIRNFWRPSCSSRQLCRGSIDGRHRIVREV